MYCSAATDEIFQRNPPFSKPSQFKPKGWTDTVQGYLNEAKKLTTCIINNRKSGRHYSWFLTIYIRQVLKPKDVAAMWTKVCRNLRTHGIVAIWVREPTKAGKVHYHLLVCNEISEKELAKVVENSMPHRKDIGWHKRIMACDGRNTIAYYITKARMKGTVRGQLLADRYAKKRLLFQSGLNLKKYGTIGHFWVRSKKQLWQEVRNQEKRIADGLSDVRVRRLAKHAFEFIEGYMPLNKIERTFGFFAHSPAIQTWMEQRFGDDGHDEDAAGGAK